MPKKIVLIGIISFAFLIFLLPTKSEAAMVYIGTKIESTAATGGTSFYLPEGTIMSVINDPDGGGESVLDSYTTTEETYIGDTIWSNAVSLTYGIEYGIRLELPSCGDPGYWDNGYCWYAGAAGESCTTVCSDYGGTNSSGCNEWDESCRAIKNRLGIPCDTCSDFCPASYNFGFGKCYSCNYQDWLDCDWSDPDFIRVCACTIPVNEFNFLFTASAG